MTNSETVSVERLRECPFCGGDAKLHGPHAGLGAWVSCAGCGLEGPTETGQTEAEATAHWNLRTQPAQPVNEPVAWRWRNYPGGWQFTGHKDMAPEDRAEPLYARPQAVEVKVKPLEWTKHGEAKGAFAKYTVYEGFAGGWNAVCYPYEESHYRIAEGVAEDAAKAAVYAHHSAAVLSALTSGEE